MDVKALLLLGGTGQETELESFGGLPLAMIDVLGESVVQRVINRVQKMGVTSVSVISEAPLDAMPTLRTALRPDVKWKQATGSEFWRAGEQQFSDFAHEGAELVLIIRLGKYAEIDYEEFVQFHLDRRARVTPACDAVGNALDAFVVSASRRNDAAVLLRNELKKLRSPADTYIFRGYINELSNAADLRRLAMDAFAGENAITPRGREIKPGVWCGEGARIHPRARVLAPAYIGARSKIRAGAVITRASTVEHHSEVDCGSVVENSTVVPFSYIGIGLDVTAAVVGRRLIANLLRNVVVEIEDERLIGMVAASPSKRTLSSAVGLAMYVPRAVLRGFTKAPRQSAPKDIPEAVSTTSPALDSLSEHEGGSEVVPQFTTNLLTARRYGNE